MGIGTRISDWVVIFISQFVDGIDNRIALERRLARDRQKKRFQQKKRMGKATDIGETAILAAQDLAVARIEANSIEEAIKEYVKNAKRAQRNAQAATDLSAKTVYEEEEQRNITSATGLSEELDEAKRTLSEQEQMVREMFQDKEEAIKLVDEQAENLRHLGREDARLVQRMKMQDMREDALRMREELMQLVPGEEEDNVRARAQEQLRQRGARLQARTDLVQALWKSKTHGMAEEAKTRVSTGAQQILNKAMEEAGYTAVPASTTADGETKKLAANQEQ